jgi:thioredoxin 1
MLGILLILLSGDPVYSTEILNQAKTEGKHLLIGRDPVLLKWRSIREDKLWCVGPFEAEFYYRNNKLYRKSRIEQVQNMDEFIKSGIVIVDFSAPWCGPCRKMVPILETISWARIGQINIDNRPDLKAKYSVQSIPAILIFKDGVLKQRIVGLTQRESLQNIVDFYDKNE